LRQLPEPQRVAVVLRYGLDYSVNEIAQATETSPNTVKYRLKEALAKMRRLVHRDRALRGDRHEDR
jgi:RNA polymerase sigma factor (sigma-70 family)